MFKQGNVVRIESDQLIFEDGDVVEFEHLAIATGSQKRYPAELDADGKVECMSFFEEQQRRIQAAESIVIVGGGAAGVEVAGDIKSKYPEKGVTLVHSRQHLLNNFGKKLREIAKKSLEDLGVMLHLVERCVAGLDLSGPGMVTLRSGKLLKCDLVV